MKIKLFPRLIIFLLFNKSNQATENDKKLSKQAADDIHKAIFKSDHQGLLKHYKKLDENMQLKYGMTGKELKAKLMDEMGMDTIVVATTVKDGKRNILVSGNNVVRSNEYVHKFNDGRKDQVFFGEHKFGLTKEHQRIVNKVLSGQKYKDWHGANTKVGIVATERKPTNREEARNAHGEMQTNSRIRELKQSPRSYVFSVNKPPCRLCNKQLIKQGYKNNFFKYKNGYQGVKKERFLKPDKIKAVQISETLGLPQHVAKKSYGSNALKKHKSNGQKSQMSQLIEASTSIIHKKPSSYDSIYENLQENPNHKNPIQEPPSSLPAPSHGHKNKANKPWSNKNNKYNAKKPESSGDLKEPKSNKFDKKLQWKEKAWKDQQIRNTVIDEINNFKQQKNPSNKRPNENHQRKPPSLQLNPSSNDQNKNKPKQNENTPKPKQSWRKPKLQQSNQKPRHEKPKTDIVPKKEFAPSHPKVNKELITLPMPIKHSGKKNQQSRYKLKVVESPKHEPSPPQVKTSEPIPLKQHPKTEMKSQQKKGTFIQNSRTHRNKIENRPSHSGRRNASPAPLETKLNNGASDRTRKISSANTHSDRMKNHQDKVSTKAQRTQSHNLLRNNNRNNNRGGHGKRN